MNIVGRAKADIFSICVINNIARLAIVFYFPLAPAPAPGQRNNIPVFSSLCFREKLAWGEQMPVFSDTSWSSRGLFTGRDFLPSLWRG